MAPSKRYGELKGGVQELRRALLPWKFDPTGTYRSPERVHLRAVSFRILVHAEIEAYIEDRAFELFDAAWKAWDTSRAPSRVMTALLAFSGHVMPTPPSRLGAAGKKDHDDVTPIVARAKKTWREEVYKKNHGIKEANILALLLPLGIDGGDLDATLLADLTSFGGERGAVAHRSSVGITSLADPKAEYQRVKQLVADLRPVDELIGGAVAEVGRIAAATRP